MTVHGITTSVLDLTSWVHDPAATDLDIVAAMRLPAGTPVEALLVDEMRAIDAYLGAWTANAGMDAREMFLRNSACKRVLYISAPIFLPDTIPVPEFVGRGVNTRIHVYEAPEVWDTVRLEAISSYAVGGYRFRYALSIQYLHDAVGLGWQLIRPVVIVDRHLLATVHDAGPDAVAALERVLDAIRRVILFGSHDYVHATVLNWFPPVKDLPPAYAAIATERVHPREVDQWHAASQGKLPDGFVAAARTPTIVPLELYSLLVHAEVVQRLWDEDPSVARHARRVVDDLDAAVTELVGLCALEEPATTAFGDYFWTFAGWFLASALPLGSDRLAVVVDGVAGERWPRVEARLAEVHGGMFDFVRHVDRDEFPWGDRFVAVHDVGLEYELALRRPGVREHLRYLLGARRDGDADRPTWLHVLGAPPDVVTALLDLQAVADTPDLDAGLRRLRDGGVVDELRRLAVGGTAGSGTEYARSVVWSLVTIIDELVGLPDRVLSS